MDNPKSLTRKEDNITTNSVTLKRSGNTNGRKQVRSSECVTAKRKERIKAEGKTRKETRKGEGHLERKLLEGDTLKLT